jgi:hypothetical protein
MIIAPVLMFIAGYLLGKNGRFYLYQDGALHSNRGAERFTLYKKGVGYFVDLFGVDVTGSVLMPVYRPVFNIMRKDGILALVVQTGDFSEVTVMVSYRFPFLKIHSESDISEARNFDE